MVRITTARNAQLIVTRNRPTTPEQLLHRACRLPASILERRFRNLNVLQS